MFWKRKSKQISQEDYEKRLEILNLFDETLQTIESVTFERYDKNNNKHIVNGFSYFNLYSSLIKLEPNINPDLLWFYNILFDQIMNIPLSIEGVIGVENVYKILAYHKVLITNLSLGM